MNERKQSTFLWMSAIKIVYSNSHNMLLFYLHIYWNATQNNKRSIYEKIEDWNEMNWGLEQSHQTFVYHLFYDSYALAALIICVPKWKYNQNVINIPLYPLISSIGVISHNKIMKYNRECDEEAFKRLITLESSYSTLFFIRPKFIHYNVLSLDVINQNGSCFSIQCSMSLTAS